LDLSLFTILENMSGLVLEVLVNDYVQEIKVNQILPHLTML